MISIILTIFNQENIIRDVLKGIYDRMSPLVNELILVFDGCTDRSEERAIRFLQTRYEEISLNILHADNIFETKANNLGLKASKEPYCLIIQDDMIVQEAYFDRRLLQPMIAFPKVFAVTARTAENDVIQNGKLIHVDKAGIEHETPRNVFAIRDSVNRGPLLLRHDVLEDLNYLDETFAPQGLDDHDLCHRAYKAGGWLAGAYWIAYRSDLDWGSSRKASAPIIWTAWQKNAQIMMERHYDTLTGPKHSEDRILE